MKFDISVVITCFNKEKYLQDAVESVLQNTWQPKEIVIVHDGCIDAMSYKDCTTIILDKNGGVSKARDIGVRNTTGHFILFLDADDKLSPDYIQKAIEANSDIAYSDILLWADPTMEAKSALEIPPARLTLDQMWHHCRIIVSSVMTRQVYDTLGGFKELPMFEDWDFWLRAIANGFKFRKFNSLFYYRQINGSRNRVSKEQKQKMFNVIHSRFIYTKGNKQKKSSIRELKLLYDKT